VLIFGGPAIFLLAQLGYMRRVTGRMPRSRLAACFALVVVAIATAPLSLLAAVTASSAVLLAVAIADTRADAIPPSSSAVAT
jgi:low temperature requirement protein LtrA